MPIVPAEGALLEEIFDLTYPVWHEGLTREAYARWNVAQTRTPWGQRHLQRVALVGDAGELLATAKRYRFPARIGGRQGMLCGLGAVFVPEPRRGGGHALALIERILEEEARAGALAAALFSEIGPRYYERLGFRSVPFDDVTVQVQRQDGSPAMLVRAGEERDLPALAAMHDVRSEPAQLALRRDAPLIQQALTRKRLFAGLSPPGTRQLEFFVAEEGVSAVAYVVLHVTAHGWTLEEAGDRDPAGSRLGALLQVLVAREPSQRTPLIRAWWPSAFPIPLQLSLAERTPSRDLFMLRPLAPGLELPSSSADVFYWRSDYF